MEPNKKGEYIIGVSINIKVSGNNDSSAIKNLMDNLSKNDSIRGVNGLEIKVRPSLSI